MKTIFRFLRWLIALGACFLFGFFLARLQHGPIILAQDAVVAEVSATAVQRALKEDAGTYIDIGPSGGVRAALIFYPGGLVRPQAYEWLGVALSQYGIRTIIPEMPLDLAVLAPERASKLLQIPDMPDVVLLAGHSLGGAMAARYALKHPADLDGLILLGAFSANADDLSSLNLPTLVLAAEHDGLATLEEMRSGLERLPAVAELSVIFGAVHSFFGRYGPQAGDGLPTVTRAEAEQAIIARLSQFISELSF